ncbi:MAG: hypothetical protein P8K79_00425 [Mariniblastus sp.]|nr:hypothetical protein [Mariniblastus sp.]
MSETPNTTCPAEISNFCAQRHWSIYWILIVCSVAAMAVRVANVGDTDTGELPFQSANDRSRWCTVRALGDQGTYVIDDVISSDGDGAAWNTIDKVAHLGTDGKLHYYSSKPTLLPTLLAVEYGVVKTLTGWNLQDDTTKVVRVMLLLTNVIPWAVFLWFFAATIDRVLVRDWSRYFALAAAGFGTYLSTFAVTLNNHLPAAVCVMVSLYFLLRIVRDDVCPWWMFAITGLASAFAAANEMPALAWVVAAALICFFKQMKWALLGFVPGALLVAVAFFGTNYLAHDDWRPAYAHRGEGPVFATVKGDFSDQLDAGKLSTELQDVIGQEYNQKYLQVERSQWPNGHADPIDRWVVRSGDLAICTIIVQPENEAVDLCAWDNWYDYPGSYWLATNDKKSLVDQGQPSRAIYAFHFLFGHHGIFSLTPIWLLALAGMMALFFNPQINLRWLAALTLGVSIVVIGFYLMRPEMDRNYGGYCCALRWLFWLAPMWLVCMLPVVDWLGRKRWGRWVCFLLLGLSILSAGYSLDNPWSLPWLYEVWGWTGIPY